MDDDKNDTMDALIGVIIDVSGSMRVNVEGKIDKGDSWLRSTFDAVDSLLEHNEISEDNKIFAICVGVNEEFSGNTFDLLGTLEKSAVRTNEMSNLTYTQIIHEGLDILKSSGAPYVKEWAPPSKIMKLVSCEKIKIILQWLRADQEFAKRVATEILPDPCRDKSLTNKRRGVVVAKDGTKFSGALVGAGILLAASNPLTAVPLAVCAVTGALTFAKGAEHAIDKYATATNDDIQNVVRDIIVQKIIDVKPSSVRSVRDASNILKGAVGLECNESLTKKRVDEIMANIEPFIYGRTPLIKALNEAYSIFSDGRYKHCNKILFVLSDGQPTDGSNPPISKLEELGVQTVGCYITQGHLDNPRQLFSTKRADWDEPTKFMFDLSSGIKTQLLPHTIFIKRGWKVEATNNRTKLFAQINHPSLLNDISDLVQNVITSRDALADVLSSVSLDIYINHSTQGFKSPKQIGGTCYANAAATVLHLAMHRIVGRDGGYPMFQDLKNEMIEIYGTEGANTKKVLERMCPKFRLHVKKVGFKGALCAVAAKRPVLATFQLTGRQWDAFSIFFNYNPKGVLTEKELDKYYNVQFPSGPGGHAVVLTSYQIKSLFFMNSWGWEWGDNGFFRVANSKVLNCEFYDVYWTLNDLSHAEKEEYKRFGQSVALNLVGRFQSLQTAFINCPKCNQNSKAIEFTGTFTNVRCPKCNNAFQISDLEKVNARPVVSLVLYLTSLQDGKR